MKIKSLKKEFTIYNDQEEPIGILQVEPKEDNPEDVKITLNMAEALTFDGVKEYQEFIDFISSNL